MLSSLVVGEAVRIGLASGATFLGLYTQGTPGRPVVLLVHSARVHSDHGVIGVLRGALADRGFTTLSIQMPVLAADARAEDYLPLFPKPRRASPLRPTGSRRGSRARWSSYRTASGPG